jgi:hypothetical protein
MAVDVDIDVEVLKCEIKKTYARVSEGARARIHLPDRASLGARLGYPSDLLARVLDGAARYVRRRRQSVHARPAVS